MKHLEVHISCVKAGHCLPPPPYFPLTHSLTHFLPSLSLLSSASFSLFPFLYLSPSLSHLPFSYSVHPSLSLTHPPSLPPPSPLPLSPLSLPPLPPSLYPPPSLLPPPLSLRDQPQGAAGRSTGEGSEEPARHETAVRGEDDSATEPDSQHRG